MVDQLVETAVQFPGYVNLDTVVKRYGIDPRRHTGEEYLYLVAKVRPQRGLAPIKVLSPLLSRTTHPYDSDDGPPFIGSFW